MPLLKRPLPSDVLNHLIDRAKKREISYTDLLPLYQWVDSKPELPEGKWCAHFPGFTLAGKGELAKTILLPNAPCEGEKIL